MIRRKISFGLSVAILSTATIASADTASCMTNCRKAYDACLKTPASIEHCRQQLIRCNGTCPAQPD